MLDVWSKPGGRPPTLSLGRTLRSDPGCGGCAVIQAAKVLLSAWSAAAWEEVKPQVGPFSASGTDLGASLSLRNLCRPLTGSTWEVLLLHSLLRGNEKETMASKSAIAGRSPGNKHDISILFPLEIDLFLFLRLFALV